MNKDSCYAFYGSLRQGMYNHARFQNDLTFLSTEIVPGFKLYALERYPIAVKSNQSSDLIIVELMRITNPKNEIEIHLLELTAGYYYEDIEVSGITVGIYLFKENQNYPHIPTGDWVEFLKQNPNS